MHRNKGIILFIILAMLIAYYLVHDKTVLVKEAFINYECLQGLTLIYFLLALFMMPLNWMLEAMKWKLAISDHRKLSFAHSFYSVLIGVSAGIFTPARLGEYVGRMSLLHKDDLAYGGMAALLSSIMQLVVTIIFGSVASIYIFRHFNFIELSQPLIISGSLLFLFILLNVFMFLPQILGFLTRFKVIRKFLPSEQLNLPPFQIVLKVFLLASLRFIVYALQYVVIFYCFDIHFGVPLLMAFVSLTFLCQTVLPLPPVASLFGRGGVALLLFTQLGIHEFVILSATISVWVINLLLPAFCGMILFINIRKLRFVYTH